MRIIADKSKDEMENKCYWCAHFYMEDHKEPTCNVDNCEYEKSCFGYCSKESIEKYKKSLCPEGLKHDIESYKVIFLDVDGVINNNKTKDKTPSGYRGVDDDLIEKLKIIVNETNAKIVLSSSWREDFVKKEQDGLYLYYHLKKYDLTIIDTIEIGGIKQDRGEQIRKYVDSHKNITNFVILDDEFKEFFIRYNLQDYIASIDCQIGLTDDNVKKAIEILNQITLHKNF